MKTYSLIGALVIGLAATVGAAEEKDTRGGTCEDAKKQHEYYCEGKVAPDAEYKFENK